ncbi:hypothetical protein A3F08_01725 [Candidatus Berkelbacteria bacterium RIFCSPHIGHO2_12_FULL_36_9]|uniref:Transposase IS200-like domain-containing protein n=1 Tax=Candidatus Berkelbacteria bacterium RIFCSPHIGHO2_12_FULL_36_9 TaxID=1797469 RepID=A0A1F5ED42_9BACT|nr:MAG: hypothetical protein A3F08_01725 [Candidatus Berkelbacteria bacterium RIFCSPHIGHO2_12_FULL_36_9]
MTYIRKDPIVNNEVYHILTKSICGYIIFNNESEFSRMINLLRFYRHMRPSMSFSQFNKLSLINQEKFLSNQNKNKKDVLVQIISYSIMPTHLHLTLKQIIDGGISLFMKNVLNSYAKYFNLKHKRKGPLWEARFKNVLIVDDKQLLHLTRYQHLNSVSAGLAEKPEDWPFSSYKEYLGQIDEKNRICNFKDTLDIKPAIYKNFVNDRIAYQKQISRIKKLLLE